MAARPAASALIDIGHAVAALTGAISNPSSPALGTWDISGLAGHLLRAFRTPVRYLERPDASSLDLVDAAAYFGAYLNQRSDDPSASDAAVSRRGADELAGVDGPGIVAAYVTAIAELETSLTTARADTLIESPFGGIRLEDYLETRIFEATVHGLDLAAALGDPDWQPPRAALSISLNVLTTLAIRTDQASTLLLTLTGRRTTGVVTLVQ